MQAVADRTELVQDGGMSVEQAAKFSSLSRSQIYELMSAGRLAYSKIGARRIVLRASLVRLLAESAPDGTN
jgi:excisionase family DNA binding protein